MEEFIEELVTGIMEEIYFDSVEDTIYTLEDFEEFSPMYDVKKKDIKNYVRSMLKDYTIVKGKVLE